MSQTDLDQGGTYRQFQRRWLGPSVGWVWTPVEAILPVTTAGTYTLVIGTTLVTISVNGNVTINLPDVLAPTSPPANSLPGSFLGLPVTIVDIGGFASANTYTIAPAAGKTIMGLASITLSANYGSYGLQPDINTGNWTALSP